MAVNLSVKVRGVENVGDALRKLSGALRAEYMALLAKTATGIEADAKETLEPKTYTGQARAMTTSAPVKDGLTWIVRSSAKHARRVEEGTKPGTNPNVEALERWGWKKLKQRGLGWLIARKIRKQGIEPYPFFRPAIKRAAGPYRTAVRDILKRAAKAWGKR